MPIHPRSLRTLVSLRKPVSAWRPWPTWKAALPALACAVALSAALPSAGCTVTRAGYAEGTRSPAAHPMFARAQQSYLRGNLDEALDLFRGYRQGFAGQAVLAEAWYWEGLIHLEKGSLDAAEQSFTHAAKGATAAHIEANAFMGLGDCAFAQDRFPVALAHYQRAVDMRVPEARNDYALYRLGVTRQRLGDWGGGQSFYQLLLRDHPHSPLVERARERIAFPARAFHVELARFADAREARLEQLRIQSAGQRCQLVEHAGGVSVWVGGYPRYDVAKAAAPALEAIAGRPVTIVP